MTCSLGFELASLHLFSVYLITQRCSSLVCRHISTNTMQLLHYLPVAYQICTSSVLWCLLSIKALVHHTSQTLPESEYFLAIVGSDSPTSASLTYLAPEQNLERAFSVAVLQELNSLPTAIKNTTEVFKFKCAIKHTFLTWNTLTHKFVWLHIFMLVWKAPLAKLWWCMQRHISWVYFLYLQLKL